MSANRRPLVVDLDGSFLRTDSLVEMLVVFLRAKVFNTFLFVSWVMRGGRAQAKAEVAARVDLEWGGLPIDPAVVEKIEQARQAGRPIILATAAPESAARSVADAHGLFDDVMSSSDTVNLKGAKKADALVARFGARGFDYIGNDRNDLHVFSVAKEAYVVRPSAYLRKKAQQVNEQSRGLGDRESSARAWIRAIRPHQWAKNLLILIPAIGAEAFGRGSIIAVVVALVVFSIFASSVYLLNDVLDVHHDRQHPKKRHRPFASGKLPLLAGFVMAGVLGAVSIAGAVVLLGFAFAAVLGFYAVLTVLYSTVLKRVVLVDVFVLAVLYGTRILAGAVAVSVPLSPWLVGFSFFAFLSLALVKRYTELTSSHNGGEGAVSGRGYRSSDSPLIMLFGVASAFAATVVLTLYIEDPDTQNAFNEPLVLWMLAPVFLLWLSRVWILSHRGQMDDDPVRFALTDKLSYLFLGAIVVAWVFAR